MQQFFEYMLVDDICLITKHLNSPSATCPVVIGCLNPHSFVEALDDEAFHQALRGCTYLLPDGDGICLALKRYRSITLGKIAGDDLHRHLLAALGQRGGKVYYMGSSGTVLSLIRRRIAAEHPTLQVRTYEPSFCDELGDDESRRIIADINSYAPDLLFVSMTAPKQEKWVEKHRKQLTGVKIVASIGAAFDFYAGTVKRAPAWALRLRLEWLVRLLKEPRRMWHRNFVSTPRFLRYLRKNSNFITTNSQTKSKCPSSAN